MSSTLKTESSTPDTTAPNQEAQPFLKNLASDTLHFLGEAWRPMLLLAGIGVLWWWITDQNMVKPYLIPAPQRVFDVFSTKSALLWQHTQVTLYETLVGFVLAVIIGLAAAILIVYSKTIERTLYPILVFAQVIPKIAIAPLFIVWLGFGPEPKIVVAILIAFFPVVISGVTGLRAVDPELLDLAATMGANPWNTFYKIRFPASLPHLFAGIKVAATLAVVGAVVGEFVGASEGLGYLLLVANGNLDSPLLFAGLFIMSFVGLAMFVVIDIAERLLLPWHNSRRVNLTTTT